MEKSFLRKWFKIMEIETLKIDEKKKNNEKDVRLKHMSLAIITRIN